MTTRGSLPAPDRSTARPAKALVALLLGFALAMATVSATSARPADVDPIDVRVTSTFAMHPSALSHYFMGSPFVNGVVVFDDDPDALGSEVRIRWSCSGAVVQDVTATIQHTWLWSWPWTASGKPYYYAVVPYPSGWNAPGGKCRLLETWDQELGAPTIRGALEAGTWSWGRSTIYLLHT